jgi:hypothetical protein
MRLEIALITVGSELAGVVLWVKSKVTYDT